VRVRGIEGGRQRENESEREGGRQRENEGGRQRERKTRD
jgi:hypothetical protein